MKKKEKKNSKHLVVKFFSFLIIFLTIVILYSRYYGTKGLIIKEYSIIDKNLPASFDGFKIVHFSDVHYGTTIFNNELENIVDNINSLKPDVIVFTGDLIDMHYKVSESEKNSIITFLNKLDPAIALYAVSGNHDKNEMYNNIITQTDFVELNNTNTFLYYKGNIPIKLVGLDDYLESSQNLDTAFTVDDQEYYTILLAHEPDTYLKLKDYSINLMLSGHSHNGQVRLPFIGALLKIKGSKTYYDEHYKVNETNIYISSGLGTSMYPFRLFNKPSINFYRFYNS